MSGGSSSAGPAAGYNPFAVSTHMRNAGYRQGVKINNPRNVETYTDQDMKNLDILERFIRYVLYAILSEKNIWNDEMNTHAFFDIEYKHDFDKLNDLHNLDNLDIYIKNLTLRIYKALELESIQMPPFERNLLYFNNLIFENPDYRYKIGSVEALVMNKLSLNIYDYIPDIHNKRMIIDFEYMHPEFIDKINKVCDGSIIEAYLEDSPPNKLYFARIMMLMMAKFFINGVIEIRYEEDIGDIFNDPDFNLNFDVKYNKLFDDDDYKNFTNERIDPDVINLKNVYDKLYNLPKRSTYTKLLSRATPASHMMNTPRVMNTPRTYTPRVMDTPRPSASRMMDIPFQPVRILTPIDREKLINSTGRKGYKVEELKKLLKERRQSMAGHKEELVERLLRYS